MEKIFSFLYMAAGIDSQLIKGCPAHEKLRNISVGFLVVLLSVLSFISIAYACLKIFDINVANLNIGLVLNYLVSIFIGLIWLMIVFNIYRACLTISGIGDGTSKITKDELMNTLPQILLAVILACCLAAPLNILLLNREINNTAVVTDVDRLFEMQENEIKQVYPDLVDSYMNNIKTTSNKASDVPIYNKLKAQHAKLLKKNSKSFVGQLVKIYQQHALLSIIIFIISIFLYLLPIFLRMIWVKGVYEYKVEFQNKIVLEKYGIYPDYFKVRFDGKEYLNDRFLMPEKILKLSNFYYKNKSKSQNN